MDKIKKHFKIFVGISVLILCLAVFFFVQKSSDLENGTMKDWAMASNDRRAVAVKILTDDEDKTDSVVKCLDKISVIPDSSNFAIRDAASLCYTGIALKETI